MAPVFRSHACFLAGALLFLSLSHGAEGSDFVTLRAWADPAYVAQKAAKSSSSRETYVAAQGEYFDGGYRDSSISKGSLGAILGFLAPTLTKQGYFPARDLKTADELVIVHWGTTMGYMNDYVQTEANLADARPEIRVHGPTEAQNLDSNQGIAPGTLMMPPDNSDEQYSNAFATNVAIDTAHEMTTSTAEGLLGYTRQLIHERTKMVASTVQETLEANMHEDRYFVILQAYDFQRLQRGEGRKMLWSVHMSIRAPGLNFKLALPRMGQVAATVYGQNNDDVVTGKFESTGQGSVEIGPLTVLSLEDTGRSKK
jgi:hypothetical protein